MCCRCHGPDGMQICIVWKQGGFDGLLKFLYFTFGNDKCLDTIFCLAEELVGEKKDNICHSSDISILSLSMLEIRKRC